MKTLKIVCYSHLLFWIILGKFSFVFASTCLIHDKCLGELRTFTQADEFHVYTSIEEVEDACNDAAEAYMCVTSAPECRDSTETAVLSPILRGSSRLLNEFCAYKSKRRPCCALRTAYLEHSSCYEEVNDRLNDCNDKFRTSLEMILGMKEIEEQNEQRFCSLNWFAKCVKKATQSYCGKVAAQVIRSYVLKAAQHHKEFITRTDRCYDTLYGFEEVSDTLCQQKHFDKCHVHLLFLHENLVEDRLTVEDKFQSLCTGLHDSFECLSRAFKRCLFNKQSRKFEKMEEFDENEKNQACLERKNGLRRYQDSIHCLVSYLPVLEDCKTEFESPAKYTSHTMPFHYYNQYFCGLIERYENCLVKTANKICGESSSEIMMDIIQMAAVNIHHKCNSLGSTY